MKDSLGDRMKLYENMALPKRFMPYLPIIIRADGVAFHTFTKGLERPYDNRMSSSMIDLTKYLVELTNARCGYTQSDEITLLLYSEKIDGQIYFDGKIQKILSVLPARASVFFNELIKSRIPEKANQFPVFDCRVFPLPNKEEAVNAFIWREKDATRNSISMAAQSLCSHSELQHKSCSEMQEMIFQKGVNWNNYPDFFKKGTYIQKQISERPFNNTELDKLPPKHAAHFNSDLTIERVDFVEIVLPPLSKIINRSDVLFDGAKPKVKDDAKIYQGVQ